MFITRHVMLQILAVQPVVPCSFNKRIEQRVHRERFGFVLRMELARDEVRMCIPWQLDHLDEPAVRRNAAEYEPFLLKNTAELGVKLVPVAVTLADLLGTVINIASQRGLAEFAVPGPQTHRAPIFVDVDKVAQLKDDR